jgi:hypothetical protein
MEDLNTISVPYSHALSALRTDSTAVFTDNDIIVRDWIKENGLFPIYGDLWASTAMSEVQSNIGSITYVYYFIYRDNELYPDKVPDNCYIYLRERNVENKEITYYTGVGMRKVLSYEEAFFDEVLEGRTIIYQVGNAIVYGIKDGK